MDYDLISLLAKSRDNCYKYKKYIKPHTVAKETNTIIEGMIKFYDHYGDEFTWDAFEAYLIADQSKRLAEDSIFKLKIAVAKARGWVSHVASDEVVKGLIETDYLTQIINECEEARDGKSDLEHVHILATNALKDLERYIEKDDLFVPSDLSVISDRIRSSGYEWRLPALNKSLGLLRSGNFVIVAARVEVGKTTFLASEVSFIAPQLPKDRPVIWVNNEEESSVVFFRVVQAALGWDQSVILADPKKAMEEYKKLMGGDENRIRVTRDTNNKRDLETLFKEVNPGMIVFDQLDKVGGFKGEDRDDIMLGKLYKWARELARTYGPVITASQLSATATEYKDPPFIGLESLRGSKTDKPGEADVVITLGKYREPSNDEEKLLRTLNVPKNKLPGGGPVQEESLRHGQFMVTINPTHARFE